MSWNAVPTDIWFYAVGFFVTFAMAFGKGAFGGGLAILGIPMLALVIDPFRAAIMTALLVGLMDIVAISAFPRSSWSKPDLVYLLPGLAVGTLLGFLTFEYIDRRILILLISVLTLIFTVRYFLGSKVQGRVIPATAAAGLASGVATGFTTYVAHSGGPTLAMYLLRRGLDKQVYAGTSVVVFLLGNIIKAPGYIWAGLSVPDVFVKTAVLFPAVLLGVWVGKVGNDRMARDTLYNLCYTLVGLAGLKLFYDSVRALMT